MLDRKNVSRAAGLFVVVGLLSVFGCASDEMGGAEIPNAKPDTRIVSRPPNLLEAGFLIDFEWTGSDPDGRIVGYEWKMSNNGIDGLSIQDTLTVCPVTGDTLSRWHYTSATDSTFLVSADMDSFPDDVGVLPDNPETPPDYPDWRSYQSHTFLVRAVDSDGAVDDTPAVVHFQATTLIPTIRVDRPAFGASGGAHGVPSMIRLRYTGDDPDYELGTPAMVRYMLKRAVNSSGQEIASRYRYNSAYEDLVSWDDPAWSDWMPYDEDPANRVAEFPNTPAGEVVDGENYRYYYLFAIQAMDIAGAVSVDRIYDTNVINLYVSDAQSPLVTFRERYLGGGMFSGVNGRERYEIARTQSVEYIWFASATHYFGEIVGYRYGWDVEDLTNDGDPGWQVGIGNDVANRRTQPHFFTPGDHTLVIEAYDSAGQVSRGTIFFNVVIVMEPPPIELLLVDDNPDQSSNAWVSENGIYTYDQDDWRDQFWQDTMDAENGGPANFQWADDSVDLENLTLAYSDIVLYQNIVWYAKQSGICNLASMFRPAVSGVAPFNWLTPYMQGVGNMLIAGSGAMHLLVENVNWLEPIVFNSSECRDGDGNRIGFCQYTLPGDDNTFYDRGAERFPYDAWGLNFIDVMEPTHRVYDNPLIIGKDARRGAACGVKGLVWDEEFKSNHLFSVPGDFPLDAIYTNENIDWKDTDYDYVATLEKYDWGGDEFYDFNATARTVDSTPQMVEVPGTGLEVPAVEPMFKAKCRFEWIQDWAASLGDPDWPTSEIDDLEELEEKAGSLALRMDLDGNFGTITDGVVIGLVSHKSRPLGAGNVLWGFDPYRFDHEKMSTVIQWVLRDHFGIQ